MPKGPIPAPPVSEPPECRFCGAVSCYCCPDCGRNLGNDEHAPDCPDSVKAAKAVRAANLPKWSPPSQELAPAPKVDRTPCKACGGTGRSSGNKQCVPCDGTGRQGALLERK